MINIDEYLKYLKKIKYCVEGETRNYFLNEARYDPNGEFGFHDSRVKRIETSLNSDNLFEHPKRVKLHLENKWRDSNEIITFKEVAHISYQIGSFSQSKYVEGQILNTYFDVMENNELYKIKYSLHGFENHITIAFRDLIAERSILD